jgi:hypothetical protein
VFTTPLRELSPITSLVAMGPFKSRVGNVQEVPVTIPDLPFLQPYRSGPSKAWLKTKNPAAPGMLRFREES